MCAHRVLHLLCYTCTHNTNMSCTNIYLKTLLNYIVICSCSFYVVDRWTGMFDVGCRCVSNSKRNPLLQVGFPTIPGTTPKVVPPAIVNKIMLYNNHMELKNSKNMLSALIHLFCLQSPFKKNLKNIFSVIRWVHLNP